MTVAWLQLRMLDKHRAACALAFALARAGRSIAARMAMMAITTSNSINVNAVAIFALFARPHASLRFPGKPAVCARNIGVILIANIRDSPMW
jgi:hypothetical protein